MTNGLARAAVRFRPASFIGSAVALMFASAVITACGVLLQTGVTAAGAPVRYAGTPVVVAADPYARTTHTVGEEQVTEQAPLPERARVDSRLAARIAARPGVAAAVADIGFPVRPAGTTASSLPPLTGRGYASAAIPAPDAPVLTAGRAPGAGPVAGVLPAGCRPGSPPPGRPRWRQGPHGDVHQDPGGRGRCG